MLVSAVALGYGLPDRNTRFRREWVVDVPPLSSDEQAQFARLLHRIDPQLRRWLLRRHVAPVDVDDLMQQLWVRLIARDKVRFLLPLDEKEAYHFLVRVTRNLLIDAFRRTRSRRWVSLDFLEDEDGELPFPIPAERDSTLELVEADWLSVTLSAIEARLDERERAVFERWWQGQNQAEIADALALSQPSVSRALRRALDTAREVIETPDH